MTPIEVAGCVVVDHRYGILCIRRSVDGASRWEIPGGKVEPGELPADAALREMHEELGTHAILTRALGDCLFTENDVDYHYTWFRGVIIGGALTPCEREFSGYAYLTVYELWHGTVPLSPSLSQLAAQIVFTGLDLDLGAEFIYPDTPESDDSRVYH